MTPNYSKYTIEELYSARDAINQDVYPDRYSEILSRIEEKLVSEDLTEAEVKFIEVSKGVHSKIGCERFIHGGVVGGFILATYSIFHFFTTDNVFADADYSLIQGLILFGLSLCLILKSRIAATLLLLVVVFELLFRWVFLQEFSGTIFGLIFVVLFFKATQSTYIWHRKYAGE